MDSQNVTFVNGAGPGVGVTGPSGLADVVLSFFNALLVWNDMLPTVDGSFPLSVETTSPEGFGSLESCANTDCSEKVGLELIDDVLPGNISVLVSLNVANSGVMVGRVFPEILSKPFE